VKTLVCVPVYNNEKTIGGVVSSLVAAGHRVLVVNDGSTDGTEASARAAGGIIERHSVNRGKGEALKTAFRFARAQGFSHLLTIDGDGQHEPQDAPLLLAAAEKSPDAIVLGVRDLALLPPKNRFGNRFSNFWVNLAMGSRFSDTQCGMRVYPADLEEARYRGHGYEFETEALIRHARDKKPIVPVAVRVYYPEERVSHFKPWRDATRIVLLVMRFLFLPRPFWTLALLLAACASVSSAPVSSAPTVSKERALQQTTLAFSASQHLVYRDGKEKREADALFLSYPGAGFRLRVLGPMWVTIFDVSVRCGRYAVQMRDKTNGGELADADAQAPFFPVRALERALRPLRDGEWRGDTFVSNDGVRARLDGGREIFSEIDAGDSLHVTVLEETRVAGIVMPKRLHVELTGGRTLDIDNKDIGFDAPELEAALGGVKCADR
jgi:hypothetical protein